MEVTGEENDNGWTPRYIRAWIFYLAQVALVIGGLTLLGMGLLGRNLLEDLLGGASVVVYLLVGVAALYVMVDRDTYLPFLGPTHVPCSALEPRSPKGADREIVVQVAPLAKVLYWASEPNTEGLKNIPSWKGAYLGYENTGVAVADASGRVVLRVRAPQPYRVPIRGLLEPHVHYRVCEESGWLGRVMTVPVEGVPTVEPFAGATLEYRAMWI
jgi:uncharacterized membrane protein YuzA (DUF378 family)